MKITGRVKFNNNGEYYIYTGDKNENLTKMFLEKLMDDVKFIIKGNRLETVDVNGELLLKKENKLFKYYIGENCIDDILWDLVDTNKK